MVGLKEIKVCSWHFIHISPPSLLLPAKEIMVTSRGDKNRQATFPEEDLYLCYCFWFVFVFLEGYKQGSWDWQEHCNFGPSKM